MTAFPDALLRRFRLSGVVAGFSVEKAEQAVPLCRALLAGGIDIVELTLRSAAGMDAICAISSQVPEMILGVGTILSPEQAREVAVAGATFGVAPGINPRVVRAAQEARLPFAPGICTPSDLETAIELGCRFVKYFPAEPMGGLAFLRSLAAPYRHLGIQYFPLGGLNERNMLEYLKEPDVPAVGGSWIVRQEMVNAADWVGISERAAAVVQLLRPR